LAQRRVAFAPAAAVARRRGAQHSLPTVRSAADRLRRRPLCVRTASPARRRRSARRDGQGGRKALRDVSEPHLEPVVSATTRRPPPLLVYQECSRLAQRWLAAGGSPGSAASSKAALIRLNRSRAASSIKNRAWRIRRRGQPPAFDIRRGPSKPENQKTRKRCAARSKSSFRRMFPRCHPGGPSIGLYSPEAGHMLVFTLF